MTRDKTAQMLGDKTIKFGKTYYDDKRIEFGGRHAPQSVLAVKDGNEVVPEQAVNACMAAFSHRKKLSPMSYYCEGAKAMNHKSLMGLLRAVLKISPAVSMPNCQVNLDAMRMLARLDLHNKFKAEVSIMKGHFDATLGKSLAPFKSHGQSAKL